MPCCERVGPKLEIGMAPLGDLSFRVKVSVLQQTAKGDRSFPLVRSQTVWLDREELWVRILTFTSLFPNVSQPLQGIFVYQRVAHVAKLPGNSITVVAPIPYFPAGLRSLRWRKFSHIPAHEEFGELDVYHPRYPLLPKISMLFHGLLMFLGSLFQVLKLCRENRFDCIDAHYVYPD